MAVKKKTLTYQEARELKWFCENVVGVRHDMYSTIDAVTTFDKRIKRLEKTCDLIEEYLAKQEQADD